MSYLLKGIENEITFSPSLIKNKRDQAYALDPFIDNLKPVIKMLVSSLMGYKLVARVMCIE
jgi:hypothetical protein